MKIALGKPAICFKDRIDMKNKQKLSYAPSESMPMLPTSFNDSLTV
jgi:hypothetical protein